MPIFDPDNISGEENTFIYYDEAKALTLDMLERIFEEEQNFEDFERWGYVAPPPPITRALDIRLDGDE